MDGPILQNLVSVSFEEPSLQRRKFQIWIEMIKPFNVRSNFVYCSGLLLSKLIMITITRHVFINIFQTKHLSTVKVIMIYEKKNELSCDTKISKSLEKSWEEGVGPL